jgi:hypothetical protein
VDDVDELPRAPLVRVVTGVGVVACAPDGAPAGAAVGAPLVFVVTRGAGFAATGALVAGAGAPVEDAVAARLECVLTGAVAGAEALGCTAGAEAADEPGPAPAVRLAVVRGPLADSVGAGAWTPTAVPGRGGAPAAGVRGRCACGGFSCLTIHTVRRTISVRTSTGGGG